MKNIIPKIKKEQSEEHTAVIVNSDIIKEEFKESAIIQEELKESAIIKEELKESAIIKEEFKEEPPDSLKQELTDEHDPLKGNS